MMTKSCPCCKVSNAVAEYRKHPSITSFMVVNIAVKKFTDATEKVLVKSTAACDEHAGDGQFAKWWDTVLTVDAWKILQEGHRYRVPPRR